MRAVAQVALRDEARTVVAAIGHDAAHISARFAQGQSMPLAKSAATSSATHDEQQHLTALVRRCLAGEGNAWEEIVRLHQRRVYNLCYRFTGSGDDAEDLTQEVFIKVYRTLKTYDLAKGAFVTWITTMT